jgi:MerR family transcriptional regulator, light-induced transcriptional regulator
MRDSQHGGQEDRGSDGLSALARTVVARLIARDGTPDRTVDEAIVASIARALLDRDPASFESLRQDLRRARVGDNDLADTYFPAVARHLGCAWAEDSAPFTDVTIGVARMQAMLRQVGRDWSSNVAPDPGGRTVLIVLPEGEQHSFGAMLMAGQLRRQGVSVRLEVGTPITALRRIVHHAVFDCAMISIACEEKLNHCKTVVKALKDGSEGRLWVAVGGALLERPVDVCGLTGADVATSDPMLALRGAMAARAKVKGVFG